MDGKEGGRHGWRAKMNGRGVEMEEAEEKENGGGTECRREGMEGKGR